MKYLKGTPFVSAFDNSLDAFLPEQWAMEGIAILMENMVAANLVHRDFEPLFAKYGDVVNTRKPAEFKGTRKTDSDDVTVQDASATNVAVPLDQHVHVSFLIRDGEETKAFKNLVDEYLRPAAIAMARFTDQIVLGQVYQFLANQAGGIGSLTASNAVQLITNVREVLNVNKAYMDNRSLILTPTAETQVLQNPTFHQAYLVGDGGTALENASLGRKLGFNTFMAQNMSSVNGQMTTQVGAVNNVGGYATGTTVLAVDVFSVSGPLAGQWVTISSDSTGDFPLSYHITAVNASPATQITLEYGLSQAATDDAVIKAYPTGLVNNIGGYAAGYSKSISIDTFTNGGPTVGQLVTFGTDLDRYTVLQTDGSTYMVLDRPLFLAVSDDEQVNLGPAGNFNFAFHRNALTLVIRPLALPRAGVGAISGFANFNGLTMRTVITYDGNAQGHLVTMDYLAGIKVLDTNLGAVLET